MAEPLNPKPTGSNKPHFDLRDALNSKKVVELRVKASQFTDKIKTLDSVSANSSSAKIKLMEMRFKSTDHKFITTNEFNSFMENKPFSSVFINNLKQKEYIFRTDKLAAGLEQINVREILHNIRDNSLSSPPISNKVADLQQFLGIKITGLFDAETFNTFLERFYKAILISEIKPLMMFEKLMLILLKLLGEEIKAGTYIKGLLVVKAALVTAQTGKTGDFEKLNLLMNKYLPDIYRFKLKERVRVIQKLFQAINSPDNEKSEKLNYLLATEEKNLVAEDKIKILSTYLTLFNTNSSGIPDKNNQISLIKSLAEEELSTEQKQKIGRSIDFLIRHFKEIGTKEMLNEIEHLYNSIKVQAFKGIIV